MAAAGWREIAELIMNRNNGQAYYSLGEAAKIIGCSASRIASTLHSAGVLVKKVGRKKQVDIYDLAQMMASRKVAPIDNRKAQ